MAQRKRRSTEELKKASALLYYEIQMWILAKYALERNLSKGLRNVWLEGFLIHTRNLIDFLFLSNYDAPLHKDDIIAEDFFVQSGLQWKCNEPLQEFDRRRIHKRVAHLTYARLKLDEFSKEWEVQSIFNDIRRLLDQFIAQASPILLDEKLYELANAEEMAKEFAAQLRPLRGHELSKLDPNTTGIIGFE